MHLRFLSGKLISFIAYFQIYWTKYFISGRSCLLELETWSVRGNLKINKVNRFKEPKRLRLSYRIYDYIKYCHFTFLSENELKENILNYSIMILPCIWSRLIWFVDLLYSFLSLGVSWLYILFFSTKLYLVLQICYRQISNLWNS